eukprot:SAG22_NODE_7419_length_741_cov_1.521807_2_plen_67_part_01
MGVTDDECASRSLVRMMAAHMMSTFATATYHQICACEIWARDVVMTTTPVLNGTVRVPDAPGLGVTI